MEQITTKQVKEWGSPGHCWQQQPDGCWRGTDVPEMTDREGVRVIPVTELDLVPESELMRSEAPAPSGQQYAGGPAKEPDQYITHHHTEA